MTLMRTPAGMNAQRKFHRADTIFHIEGKNLPNTPGFNIEDLCDYKYYKSLLEHYLPQRKIKIKVLGCCNDVLKRHKVIVENKLSNNHVIVDKDYNGLLSSRVNDKGVIYTSGYSWENDFWSENICLHLISMLTAGDLKATQRFSKVFRRCIRRVAILNKINLCFKSHGIILFKINKKGGKRGIALNFSSDFILLSQEFFRLIKQARNCACIQSVSELYKNINANPANLIQGHFFEYLVCNLIVSSAKNHSLITKDVDFEAIKNIALYVFSDNPKLWFEPAVYRHYQTELSKV